MTVGNLIKKLGAKYWELGFIQDGLDSVMGDKTIHVEWIKSPKDSWYADPFILEVTDDEIQVFVEEMLEKENKGVISLLKIDRHNWETRSKKIVLELPTHISFPCILRENGKIYIYPENACGGRLDMYEYDPITETTNYFKTICDDEVWDSCITDRFGEKMVFTAAHDDTILDIYKWDEVSARFLPWKQVHSDNKNSRMGGQLFEYKGDVYYPAQDCNRNYGSAIQIKKINYSDGVFSFETVKRITSTHPKMELGLHTLNEYKGIVVIDVYGYRYPIVGKVIDRMMRFIKAGHWNNPKKRK